jgi:hypothetical protein
MTLISNLGCNNNKCKQMNNKLSADPISLILGIVSLVLVFFGCCCGFFVVISLGLAIVGIVLANKSLVEFDNNSEVYSPQSRSNVAVGKIVCIVATVVSAVFTVFYIAYFAFFGSLISRSAIENYLKNPSEIQQIEDTVKTEYKEDLIVEDTVYKDTLEIEQK